MFLASSISYCRFFHRDERLLTLCSVIFCSCAMSLSSRTWVLETRSEYCLYSSVGMFSPPICFISSESLTIWLSVWAIWFSSSVSFMDFPKASLILLPAASELLTRVLTARSRVLTPSSKPPVSTFVSNFRLPSAAIPSPPAQA